MLILDMMSLLRYCDSNLQWSTTSSKSVHSYAIWTSLRSFFSLYITRKRFTRVWFLVNDTLMTIPGRVREWLAAARTVLLRCFILTGAIGGLGTCFLMTFLRPFSLGFSYKQGPGSKYRFGHETSSHDHHYAKIPCDFLDKGVGEKWDEHLCSEISSRKRSKWSVMFWAEHCHYSYVIFDKSLLQSLLHDLLVYRFECL
jgi:hypothetical protein